MACSSRGLLLFEDGKIHIFKWKDLKRQTCDEGATVKIPDGCPMPSPSSPWFSRHSMGRIVTIDRDPSTSSALVFWLDFPNTKHPSTAEDIHLSYVALASTSIPEVKFALGIHKSELYFLTRQGWICSPSFKSLPSLKSYTRYFFIPPLWQVGTDFVGAILSSKSVAFAYRDEPVIFKEFLEFEDKVAIEKMA
jgi:hypothetical protein